MLYIESKSCVDVYTGLVLIHIVHHTFHNFCVGLTISVG